MPEAPRLTKDQQRATFAYGQVGQVARLEATAQDNYKTAVRALGANILRSGLSAALADLQRRKDRAKALREHLAEANVPGLAGAGEADLFQRRFKHCFLIRVGRVKSDRA